MNDRTFFFVLVFLFHVILLSDLHLKGHKKICEILKLFRKSNSIMKLEMSASPISLVTEYLPDPEVV